MKKLTFLEKAAAIAAIVAAGSGIIFWIIDHSKSPPPSTVETVTQSGTGIASGRDTVINGPVYNTPQPAVSYDSIYQAGIVVGKAFGGRRLPNDATRFEFTEITNCAQFNPSTPFTYAEVKLIFEKERDSALIVAGRNDNPIRFGVIARVLE